MKGTDRLLTKAVSTVGFIGMAPFAPGTFGSLAALVFLLALRPSPSVHAGLIALFFIAGVISSGGAERAFGRKDPPEVVIDEFAGYMTSVVFLPPSLGYMAAGFILFRVFDIIKPPPIRRLERSFEGGLGVMLDDLFAGVYANAVLQAWRFLNGS